MRCARERSANTRTIDAVEGSKYCIFRHVISLVWDASRITFVIMSVRYRADAISGISTCLFARRSRSARAANATRSSGTREVSAILNFMTHLIWEMCRYRGIPFLREPVESKETYQGHVWLLWLDPSSEQNRELKSFIIMTGRNMSTQKSIIPPVKGTTSLSEFASLLCNNAYLQQLIFLIIIYYRKF